MYELSLAAHFLPLSAGTRPAEGRAAKRKPPVSRTAAMRAAEASGGMCNPDEEIPEVRIVTRLHVFVEATGTSPQRKGGHSKQQHCRP